MIFKGSCPAIVTPFNDDASAIDFDAFAKMLEFQIANGSNAVAILGTTGEPSTMTKSEKCSLIEFAIEKVAKRVPVIVGTGCNNTKEAIENSKFAKKAGADAILVVTPYYNKCTQKGLVAHYNAVFDEVNIPAIVYNVPARTGVNIAPATLEQIFKHKNAVAVKEASSDIIQACEYSKLLGDDKYMYCGDDEILLPMLSIGACGVISVTANVAPKFYADFCQKFFDGDIKTAQMMQRKAQNFAHSMFCEVNPIPIKAATKLIGLTNGAIRMPLSLPEEKSIELITKTMKEMELL